MRYWWYPATGLSEPDLDLEEAAAQLHTCDKSAKPKTCNGLTCSGLSWTAADLGPAGNQAGDDPSHLTLFENTFWKSPTDCSAFHF